MATNRHPIDDATSTEALAHVTQTERDFDSESQIADPPSRFWSSLRYFGPGLILSAAVVGSGELIAMVAAYAIYRTF